MMYIFVTKKDIEQINPTGRILITGVFSPIRYIKNKDYQLFLIYFLLYRDKKPGHFYPFGDGYRMCPGKMMALSEIKMYFALLLKNFNIRLADKEQELKTKSYLTVQTVMIVEEPVEIVVAQRTR